MQITQNEAGEKRREFFTGTNSADIFDAMDRRAKQLAEKVVHRTAIGRNQTCPCGSGGKFKKCCMPGARRVASRR